MKTRRRTLVGLVAVSERILPCGALSNAVGVVAILSLIAGCAALPRFDRSKQNQPIVSEGFSIDATRTLFDVGYQEIEDVYVERMQIGAVALDGLRRLTKLDQSITVERVGANVLIKLSGQPFAAQVAPEVDDVHGWADLTAKFIDTARHASPVLAAAEPETLYAEVWKGVLTGFDRFSHYSGAEVAAVVRASRDGFGGIGANLDPKNPRVISAVLPHTPAADNLRPGDELLEIDRRATSNLADKEIVPLLRGPIESTVDLTIKRSNKTLRLTLTRVLIADPTVFYRREAGDFGYFKVTAFNVQTALNLGDAIASAKKEIGPAIRGLVLDLRDNPGGLLDQGVEVARLFLNSGRILKAAGRIPKSNYAQMAKGTDVTGGLPLIVLINGRTASSAEVVAAALQDLGRAVIVGSSSYGKGTIQSVRAMPNQGELILTWARLYAPSGYLLHRIGVIPNVCTAGATTDPVQAVDSVRSGKFDPAKIISMRRQADRMTIAAQDALVDMCPRRPTDPKAADADLEVARILLTDPALLHRSIPSQTIAEMHE